MNAITLFDRATKHRQRLALRIGEATATYDQLLAASAAWAEQLLVGAGDLSEQRVAFLVPPGIDHVAVQWGIWRAGGVAVPLCANHPPPELAYVLDDTRASIVIAAPACAATLQPLAEERKLRFLTTESMAEAAATAAIALPTIAPSRRAMILYTSGTTSRPKGVIITHANLEAQITSLVQAWRWTPHDRILHVLPLHHIHGIVNVLCCALWCGAMCEFLPRFEAEAVWSCFRRHDGPTLFMAVPTIYHRLIEAWQSASPAEQKTMSDAAGRLRLMVSGSAALPVPVLERWRQITGHTLLERYGMTEIGMGLSNPYDGPRRPGCVGSALPGVQVRLRDGDGHAVPDGQPGEIQVRGPGVFDEYWCKPQATAEAFTGDGFFRTGDVAVHEDGVYRILGRASIDIIKTGGYKVSALEIEQVLLDHEAIRECAVIGIDDEEWGQRVCAAVVLQPRRRLDLRMLRQWAKARMAVYKIPTRLLILAALPRNAMGKVSKPELASMTASPCPAQASASA